MYKLHLILKYLRKRRIAWVSLVAVTLCTAMVLVVISVMGGWLRMFRESFHGLSGDIMISRDSLSGFSNYEEMIKRIEAVDGVAQAVPGIETFGLLNIAGQVQRGVRVMGLPLEHMDRVSRFRQSLYRQWKMAEDPEATPEDRALGAKLRSRPASFDKPMPPEFYRLRMPEAVKRGRDPSTSPGMIIGAGIINIHKNEQGKTIGRDYHWADAMLTVLGTREERGGIDPAAKTPRSYWIVDDSHTGIWQYDDTFVYVPLETLQHDLQMDRIAGQNGNLDEPARITAIQVGLKPGYDMYAVKPKIKAIVDELYSPHDSQSLAPINVFTWEEQPETSRLLHAVEKEKVLVTMLFGIISLVAIFLIFCIFFMIVAEKTRDIGIIKSVGATNRGVAAIFLGYGLAIGVVGGFLGLLASYLIVHNINALHEWMGKQLGVTMWDPETYAFDTIPSTMSPREVVIIVGIAIVASVIGATVPAIRAARMHPIEALRWE